MKPTLHQLKVFSKVAELKSITAAAKVLYMAQPGVSMLVKQLEAHYGLPLIEIIGKKLYLTQAGEELYQAFRDIDSRLANIDMIFSDKQGRLKGQLSVAVVSTAKYFVPHLLGEFRHRHPEVEIRLQVTNRETVIDRLEKNWDDLVILSQLPKKMSIVAEPILEDLLVFVAHPKHPLAKQKNIPLKKLESEAFIIREEGSGTRMAMERLFEKYKLKPKIVMELGSSEAIKQAVMADIGLSLLSKISLEAELALKKLVILDIKGFPYSHYWYAVYPKGKVLTPIAKKFLEFLTKV